MIRNRIWSLFLGLLILSATAIPSGVMAQGSTGDDVAQKLAEAQEISAISGRPILAVVSNLDTT